MAQANTASSISNGVSELFSCRSIFALLVVVLLGAAGSANAADARSCVVDRVEGPNARYWVAGDWLTVVAGSTVPADAKFATDDETRVLITCGDGTVVTIGTRTEINLENLVAISGRREPVAMQLIYGIIGLFLPDATGAGFEVRTPVAIASVRSTRWLMEWDPKDAAAVFVRSGTVTVRGTISGRYILREGEGITIAAGGETGPVKTWGAARIEQSIGRLGFEWR